MTSSRSCVDTSYSDFERARLSLDRFTFSFFSAQKKKNGLFSISAKVSLVLFSAHFGSKKKVRSHPPN